MVEIGDNEPVTLSVSAIELVRKLVSGDDFKLNSTLNLFFKEMLEKKINSHVQMRLDGDKATITVYDPSEGSKEFFAPLIKKETK